MARRLTARLFAAGIFALAAVIVLAAVPAHGQDRPEEGTVFAEETRVVAVEVPVQVFLDGEPVRGLKAESFRIFEGREPRPLTGFEVVDLATTGPGAASGAPFSVAPAGRRHILLFFDLVFTRPGRLSSTVEAARSFVRESLHPSDLVGIVVYSDRRGASLLLQFTPDRAQVERALDAFAFFLAGKKDAPRPVAGRSGEAGAADPLGLTIGGWDVTLAELAEATGYGTREARPAQQAQQGSAEAAGFMDSGWASGLQMVADGELAQFMNEAEARAAGGEQAARAAYLADNLEALAQVLRGIEGPKHLFLLSEGFDAELFLPDTGGGAGGGAWLTRVVYDMLSEVRAHGWVIHAVDLRGVPEPVVGGGDGPVINQGFTGRSESLLMLTRETGGMLAERTGDFAGALGDVLERTNVTYVLTFQVADLPEDGAFHPIRVELVDGPKGARVVHRTGYHAPRPLGEREPREKRVEAAARILSGEEIGALPATLRATALAYEGGRARVPLVVEIAGEDLLAARAHGEAELFVYAFDDQGAVADYLARSVTLDASDVPAADGRGGALAGVKLAGELELPPGRQEIRALVRSRSGHLEAVRTFVIEVPAPGGPPSLLPPLFVQRGGERWLVASLGGGPAAATDGGEGYPFVVQGKRIAPAAAPVLAAGEPSRVLLPGFGLGREGVRLVTRIVTETGEEAGTGRLRVVGQRAPEAGQPDLLVAELDPTGLAPGGYRLEVSLAGSEERVAAPFRVEG